MLKDKSVITKHKPKYNNDCLIEPPKLDCNYLEEIKGAMLDYLMAKKRYEDIRDYQKRLKVGNVSGYDCYAC